MSEDYKPGLHYVAVENVGTVYEGKDRNLARQWYNDQVKLSIRLVEAGRCKSRQVCLYLDGHLTAQMDPRRI